MRAKLTKTYCKNIAYPDDGLVRHWDTEIKGFGLFVRKTSATWYYQYDRGTRTQRQLIGRYPAVDADAARETADRLSFELRRGAAKSLVENAPTLREAKDLYLARPKLRSEHNKTNVRKMIDGHLGDWLDLPLNEITRSMVVKRHQRLSNRPVLANHTLQTFRTIWNHARRAHNLPEPPTIAIEWHEERPDGRIIEDLPGWKVAVEGIENSVHRAAYHLALLTGFRKAEVCALRWENVSEDRLHLPETKNGRPFDFPISQAHRDILATVKGLDPEWVFPAPKAKTGYLNAPTRIEWSFHTCRRTFATVGVETGVLEEVVGRLLNHTPQSVTGARYVRPSLDALRVPMEQIVAEITRRLNAST